MAQKVLKLQVESGEIKKTIKKFEGVKDTCPYCNQQVAEEYLRRQLRELDIELDGVKHDLKSVTHNERLIREKESEALKFSDECSSNFYTTRDEIKTVRYELANLKVKIEENKKFLINYENDIKKLQKEINPFLSLKEKNEKECLNVGSLLDKIENTLDELNKKYSLYEFWVKGFKDIRLFVVSQALQEFEICINNNLQRLGLNDWLVKLDIERDVDKGRSVKRGFTVMVQSPYNDRYVSFKCWGGGVSQRLRLAGTMGLIDLIRSRTGVECNIEVWDEPTQWLSEQGIDDLLYVLEERAKEGSKKVFLIDHRKLQSFGGFYNIINIIKDKSGSIIEVR
jgi:DNA repair exonuclease SbcCD ATPase subunit